MTDRFLHNFDYLGIDADGVTHARTCGVRVLDLWTSVLRLSIWMLTLCNEHNTRAMACLEV